LCGANIAKVGEGSVEEGGDALPFFWASICRIISVEKHSDSIEGGNVVRSG
jgi:hypothetical protein